MAARTLDISSTKTAKNEDGSPNFRPLVTLLPHVFVSCLQISFRLAPLPTVSMSCLQILCRAWYVITDFRTELWWKNIYRRVLQISVNQEFSLYACLPGHACIRAKALILRGLRNTLCVQLLVSLQTWFGKTVTYHRSLRGCMDEFKRICLYCIY